MRTGYLITYLSISAVGSHQLSTNPPLHSSLHCPPCFESHDITTSKEDIPPKVTLRTYFKRCRHATFLFHDVFHPPFVFLLLSCGQRCSRE
ncbi:hypothetical protein K437DRAFT_166482 [Tilletiaria anomala UBC 951]|uniref:Uncharacterized protein n=1 Tax=Tilletiaria anomala (strain ATCC 24038 / CBS 436.72 / UBC 951) TaxID=1037660 RepID=A0A066VUE5_TILAU|nr:uncharacterized protein K437DRAFT_166482 [Tilletiaria anomala UBC 951]KDN42195.1 hypothetical protein K437DRAFT_166482 [Tilletiaria anomala UBC 951]